MAAYTLEYEQDLLYRLRDVSFETKVAYVEEQLRATIAERNRRMNNFALVTDRIQTFSSSLSSYENLTYKKSEEYAQSTKIEKRFALENLGWEAVRSKFFDLPLYSTILLFSPPPSVKIEGYDGGSMAYFYHILPHEEGDPEKRTIKALTLMHTLEKDEQAAILNTLDRGIIGPVASSEESILLHPAFITGTENSTKSFRNMWNKVKEVYKRKTRDFDLTDVEEAEVQLLHGEKVWRDRYKDLSLMTRKIAEEITRGASAMELQKKWRIMINKGNVDMANPYVKHKKGGELLTTVINSEGDVIFDSYEHLNKEIQMRATPCGPSGEITFSRDSSMNAWSFDVTKPGAEESSVGEKTLSCTCPFCNKRVDAIIKNNRITCPKSKGGCGRSAPYEC